MFILLLVANLPTNTVGTVDGDEYDDNGDDNDDVAVIADRRNRCNDMKFVNWNATENVVIFVDGNNVSNSKAIRMITFLVVVTIVNLFPQMRKLGIYEYDFSGSLLLWQPGI